jgi:hypothetical protein
MKFRLISAVSVLGLVAGLAASTTGANANTITFTTFVQGSDIAAAVGQTTTIAFNYTGTGFVGSVYPSNNQLYSTNLTGGNVMKFGSPISGFGGEIVIGVGLGQAGFARGAVYAGNGAGGQIDLVPASGSPSVFATLPSGAGVVRQILFDPTGNFGHNMLVTSTSGQIYEINSAGTPTLLANIGADTEGMDIASTAFGPYSGWLLVSSEGTGLIHAISPGGVVNTLDSAANTPIVLGEAETVSTVPANLGVSGNPVEGFYVANYPVDIQKAAASEFAGLQGTAIVTGEFGSNSPVTDIAYDSGTGFYDTTLVGNLPNQSEDGIFVTAERQMLLIPEPSTWAMMLMGFAGIGFAAYRKSTKAAAAA